MTDDELQGTTIDHRFALSLELGVISELLHIDGLNETGLRHVWTRLQRPNDIWLLSAAILMARDDIATRVAHQLSDATGVPASHWLDRPLIDIDGELDAQ